MKAWIIASLVFSVLVLGGFALVSAISNGSDNIIDSESATPVKSVECSGCGNGCTAGSNCGLATCGAVSGTGSCGCGK
jgi:hypothetical protein